MADLVEFLPEVKENIFTLAAYRKGSEHERWFHNRTIKNGKLFVALKSKDGYLFSSSKFAGYKANTTAHANDLNSRDGRLTNIRLDGLIGKHLSEGEIYDAIDSAFISYCQQNGIAPSKHHRKRRYWLIDESYIDSVKRYHAEFERGVAASLKDSSAARRQRLAVAPKKPQVMTVTTNIFRRNEDVVAEVLIRAKGICERCLQTAPFVRVSDNTPYLEVHHIVQLAKGGDDSVENAIALCPNCHREKHYG